MKPTIFKSVLFLLFTAATFAQGGMREKREELKSVKVAFITDALKLTATEAQKFWPVYNEFEEKQFNLREKKFHSFKKRIAQEDVDSLSDKEATTMLADMEETETTLHNLKRQLVKNLKPILPPRKIVMLKKAEDDFNKKLLQQYKKKKG